MAIVFWAFLALTLYTYVGYGLLIWLLSRVRPKPIKKAEITPSVSIVIAAYNEEKCIAEKLDNVLSLNYPEGRLEIIVGSDASDDATDSIVRSYASRGVSLVRLEGRQGKTAVQNRCAEVSRGEILVFTDATTRLRRDSIRMLMRNFADESVGCVGGKLIYRNKGSSQIGAGGVGYWSYEVLMKRWESAANSSIGVSGCFYAVRSRLYRAIETNLISDFVIALDTFKNGYRVAYEEGAVCEEDVLDDGADELAMRVRVALRTYSALRARQALLNPFKFGLFSVQLISHKMFRYSVGLFLITLLISNLFLLSTPFYQFFLFLQAGFYGSAFVGHLCYRGPNKQGILAIPHYFVLVNMAALIALAKFCRGETMIVWAPQR
ncbi:MAG: glycosyltransferase family 2 protein [Gammaproteobacteria bacterium]|nr:glycosyltransferase family 2 protein [Gammaproteobacteria bacterium]